MSGLKEVPISQLKQMDMRKLRELGSFIVTADGDLFALFVIPETTYIKNSAKNLCILSNAQLARRDSHADSSGGVEQE